MPTGSRPECRTPWRKGQVLEHEIVDEPLELGLDLPLDELGELGAVLLERSCDGRFEATAERSMRHALASWAQTGIQSSR
jgi:hypothetical protein